MAGQENRATEALEKIRDALSQRSADVGLSTASLRGLVTTSKLMVAKAGKDFEELSAAVDEHESDFEDPLEALENALEEFSSDIDSHGRDLDSACSEAQGSLQEIAESVTTLETDAFDEAFATLATDIDEIESDLNEKEQEVVDQRAEFRSQVQKSVTALKAIPSEWATEQTTLGAWGTASYDGSGSNRTEEFAKVQTAIGDATKNLTDALATWKTRLTEESGDESLYASVEAALTKQVSDVNEMLGIIKSTIEAEDFHELDIAAELESKISQQWKTNAATFGAEVAATSALAVVFGCGPTGIIAAAGVLTILPTTLVALKTARMSAEAIEGIVAAINPFD